MADTLKALADLVISQQKIINKIATHLEQIESIGGGGSASIEDFASNKAYKRNTLVVDTNTETVYRVISDYTSSTFEVDKAAGKLKLVGYESGVVTFAHNPSQSEIDVLPDDTLVAVYSSTDTPYVPD